MKIGLILNPFSEAHPTGLGRCVYEVASGIMELRPTDSFVLVVKKTLDARAVFPRAGNIEEQIVLGDTPVWRAGALAHRDDLDVLVSFTPIAPLRLPRAKLITFAHDFAYLRFDPWRTSLPLWFLHLVSFARSRHICAVSTFTAHEVSRLFFMSSKKISVVYSGYDHGEVRASAHDEAVPRNYFLAVGVVKERKNTLRIVQAFALFSRTHPTYTLQIAGSTSGKYAERVRRYVEKEKLSEKVSFLGFVSDEKLDELYAGAVAVVYPSLVEGFGLPSLEAMARGVPVITSDHGALAEVAGDAAMLVCAEDVRSIAAGMETSIAGDNYRVYRERGLARVREFPWSVTVKGLSEAIDALA